MRYLEPAEDRYPIPGVQIRVKEFLVCLDGHFSSMLGHLDLKWLLQKDHLSKHRRGW